MSGSLGLSLVNGCIDGVLKYNSEYGYYQLVPNYILEGGLPASLYLQLDIGQYLAGPFAGGAPPNLDAYINGLTTYALAIDAIKNSLVHVYRDELEAIRKDRALGWLAACVAGHSASYSVSWVKINPMQDPYDGLDDAKLGFTLCPDNIRQTTATTEQPGYFDLWRSSAASSVSIVIWQTTAEAKPVEYFQQVYEISTTTNYTEAEVHLLIVAAAEDANADPNADITTTIDGELYTIATATRTCNLGFARAAKKRVWSDGPYFCGQGLYALLTDMLISLNMAEFPTSYKREYMLFLGWEPGLLRTPVLRKRTITWSMSYNNDTGLLTFSYSSSGGIITEVDLGDPTSGPSDIRVAAYGTRSVVCNGTVQLLPGLATADASTLLPINIDPDALLLGYTSGGAIPGYSVVVPGKLNEKWLGNFYAPDDIPPDIKDQDTTIAGIFYIGMYPLKIVDGKIQYQVLQYGVV